MEELDEALLDFARGYSQIMEQWARNNRPWTDRTGDARKGLTGFADLKNNKLSAGVGHSVEYGEQLEMRRAGKYAILKPTIERFLPSFERDLSTVLQAKIEAELGGKNG